MRTSKRLRTLAAVSAAAMAFGLAACENGDDNGADDGGDVPAEDDGGDTDDADDS